MKIEINGKGEIMLLPETDVELSFLKSKPPSKYAISHSQSDKGQDYFRFYLIEEFLNGKD